MNIIDGNRLEIIETERAALIDVFRASTSIIIMLHKNAKEIIPLENEKSAFEYFKIHDDYILVGENNGIKINGFDYDNSPYDLLDADLNGKSVIFVSTNGTRVLKKISAKNVYIASFLNADLLVKRLSLDDPLVCANRKDLFSIEDFICASYIKAKKLGIEINYERIKNIILSSKSSLRLRNLGHEKDIEISLSLNKIPILPVFKNGKITKLEV